MSRTPSAVLPTIDCHDGFFWPLHVPLTTPETAGAADEANQPSSVVSGSLSPGLTWTSMMKVLGAGSAALGAAPVRRMVLAAGAGVCARAAPAHRPRARPNAAANPVLIANTPLPAPSEDGRLWRSGQGRFRGIR